MCSSRLSGCSAEKKNEIIVMSCTHQQHIGSDDERQTHFFCQARQDSALKFRIFSISAFFYVRAKIKNRIYCAKEKANFLHFQLSSLNYRF